MNDPLTLLIAGVLIALVVALVLVVRAGAARDRLSEQLEMVSALLDGDPVPRVLTRADGRVVACNRAGRDLVGAVTPLTWARDHLAEDVDGAEESFARLAAAADATVAERVELPLLPSEGVHVEGQPEWWQLSVRPVPVRGRREPLLVWAAEDVSARRVIDDILVREREDLAEFLYFAPVGLYSADAEGRLRFVNQRLAEWLGTTPEDLLGGSLDTIIADGAAPEMEGAWRGDLTFVERSGRTFPALVLQTTYDDVGETRTRTVVVRDGLQAPATVGDDRRFRWLFDGAPVGLCLLDLEGMVSDVNPAFERMAGLGRDALIDRPLHEVLAAEDRRDLDALMQRVALGAAATVHREVRMAASPDTVASLYVAPMGAGAGVDGLVAHFIDTTAQRSLEEQFAQAQKMQAMGQLAGGVAHDFNNLLTAMIGFCDLLLQRHGPGDPSFADIMQIKQNSNRAANLVRQLLAFSRKQPLKPRLLDVTDALAEMSHLLRRLLGESVQLDMRHGRDVGLVRVDPGQFDQVVINLAVNARDAMPGGGRLTIRTRSETVAEAFTRGAEEIPPGEYAVITVADTGIGIPRENLGRIFEPFFSTKTGAVGAGTGLGLSTVYGIIRQTGGFIFVDSAAGKGTAFTIYLPRQDALSEVPPEGDRRRAPRGDAPDVPRPKTSSEQQVRNGVPAAPKTPPADDLTGGGTLLLVEDEDAVRVFAARALRNKGYTVLEARTGEGGLEVLKSMPHIDLLITDMVMPGMDGATLARQVRSERPDLKVILISGYSEEAARGEIAESVDFHFLPKPFSLNQLAAKVKDLLAQDPETPTESG